MPIFCSTFSYFIIQRPGLCAAFRLPLDLYGGLSPLLLKTALTCTANFEGEFLTFPKFYLSLISDAKIVAAVSRGGVL